MHSFLSVPDRDIEIDRYFIITFCSSIISASSLWMVSLNLLTLFVNFCRWSRLYSSWTFSRVFWFSNSTLVKVQYFKPTLIKQASNCDFKLLQDTKKCYLNSQSEKLLREHKNLHTFGSSTPLHHILWIYWKLQKYSDNSSKNTI